MARACWSWASSTRCKHLLVYTHIYVYICLHIYSRTQPGAPALGRCEARCEAAGGGGGQDPGPLGDETQASQGLGERQEGQGCTGGRDHRGGVWQGNPGAD
eukprot:scaffold75189_cov45-Phaeocystis_antarctica.AAC.1